MINRMKTMNTNVSTNIVKHAPNEDSGQEIKRPVLNLTPGAVIKQQVVEAKAEARRIIAEADEYAARVRASVDDHARAAREAAYNEGYESSLLEFNQILLEMRERRDMALAEAERDLVRLSVKLAERIIGRDIETDEKTIAEIVAKALETARQHETVTVRVNPNDMRVVQAHRERFDNAGRVRFLSIVADHRVSSGGCVIESEAGTVDARLETQLRVLERALLARAAGEHS